MGGGSPVAAPQGMAPGSAGAKRPASKLGQMRFMQRAAQRTAAAQQAEQPTAEDPDRWTSAGAPLDGCRVIVEDAPLPGAPIGHMSFGAFNPAVEALQADVEATAVAAAARRAVLGDVNGASISDEAMAAALAGSRSGSGGAQQALPAAAGGSSAGVAGSSAAAGAGRGGGADSGESCRPAAAASIGNAGGDADFGSGILRFDGGGGGGGSNNKQGGKRQAEAKVTPLREPKRKKHERKLS